jgi:hypothetical protein
VQETLASNSKFKSLTGWTPKTSLKDWLNKWKLILDVEAFSHLIGLI